MMEMSDLGFDIKKFHFIGHALGAHLIGQIGRTIKANKNIEIQRITGLDPAGTF
jgi:hypothetical protein